MKGIVAGVAAVLLAAVAYFSYPAFRARTDVAGDRVLKKLDSLLGETQVQKKEVEIAIERMEQATEELTKGRINCKVQAERLGKEAGEVEAKIADADNSLRRLRELLSSQATAEIAGKTYSQTQIQEMAGKVLQARKTLEGQKESFKLAQARLEKSAAHLEEREGMAKGRLSRLRGQLREIEAEMVSLRAMKDAASAAGDSDKALASNFEELERKVAALHDKVKTEARYEDEKWKLSDAKRDLDETQKVIDALKAPRDVVADIDRILGTNKK